jgi:hypothetical protein
VFDFVLRHVRSSALPKIVMRIRSQNRLAKRSVYVYNQNPRFGRHSITVISLMWILIVGGCRNNPATSSLGKDFVESQTKVSLIDTFSVSLSTVIFDRVVTSGEGCILIGNYHDDVYGTVTSNSYFQVGVPESYDVQSGDIYDSLHLVLQYNKHFFGDTTKSQRIVVNHLTQNIVYDDQGAISSNASFTFDPSPVGSVIYTPRPNGSTDTLTIKIDDAIGLDLFRKLTENSEIMTDNTLFRDYFHGLVLRADEHYEGSIVGFTTIKQKAKLVLFSRMATSLAENDIAFGLEDSARQFNNIVHDFNSTKLRSLTQQRYQLSSSVTGGLSFLQGGIGLAIRVDFPSFQEALLFKRMTILAAQLSITPEKNSYDKFDLPSALVLYETDGANRLGNGVASSSLVVDKLYEEETAYTFDVTSFLKSEVANSYVDPEKGLLITPSTSDQTNGFSRMIADAHGKNTKLRIYYLSY